MIIHLLDSPGRYRRSESAWVQSGPGDWSSTTSRKERLFLARASELVDRHPRLGFSQPPPRFVRISGTGDCRKLGASLSMWGKGIARAAVRCIQAQRDQGFASRLAVLPRLRRKGYTASASPTSQIGPCPLWRFSSKSAAQETAVSSTVTHRSSCVPQCLRERRDRDTTSALVD
ncbi:hypothetical protein C8R47DRAFT_1101454, partial [Mycena vitilis]